MHSCGLDLRVLRYNLTKQMLSRVKESSKNNLNNPDFVGAAVSREQKTIAANRRSYNGVT